MRSKMYIDIRVKDPLLLSNFNQNFNFLDIFSKNVKMSNFMKKLPVGAEFFHVDETTGRHDPPNSRLSQFC